MVGSTDFFLVHTLQSEMAMKVWARQGHVTAMAERGSL